MLSADGPFVLLEDARRGAGPGRCFSAPVEVVTAQTLAEVGPALERVRAGLKRGLHAAGWLSYEAGIAFEQRLMERAQRTEAPSLHLVWFGLFEAPVRPSSQQIADALPDAEGAYLSPPRPRVSRDEYERAFARAKAHIVGGDIYQVNLSYRADLKLQGDPLAAYARLRASGQGGWSGAVFDGANWLLSTSPELFFRVSGRAIEARPMKGTAKRRADAEQDRAAAAALRADPKEQAENVMIVDLTRNDLSRLAVSGSVHVAELFKVETYPTLHTLTSTVRAELKPEHDVIDCLRTLFPCGSITGAPKIRAMEIIRALETDQRGAYTGSIGWISPDGDAEFNVAIRTLAVRGERAEVGIGSAVVFDSSAEGEWEECIVKSGFVRRGQKAFDLFETMRFEPGGGIHLFELHLARLSRSARDLDFVCDEASIRARLDAELLSVKATCVVRLSLSAQGEIGVARRDLPAKPPSVAEIAWSRRAWPASDFRLRHKTTLRGIYDDARAAAPNAFETILVDQDGFVTEGCFTNVFLERNGVLLTPPLARGLLPGVLRTSLLQAGRAIERDIRLEDLSGGLCVGNAVRGLIPARLI